MKLISSIVRGLVDENIALSWFDPSRNQFVERTVTRVERAEAGQVSSSFYLTLYLSFLTLN